MFIESPRFPEDISLGVSGGASFLTDEASNPNLIVSNATRTMPQHKYDVTHGIRTADQFLALKRLFMVCRGKWGGFRFKDWTDFAFDHSTGFLALVGPGRYQIFNRYAYGGQALDRKILKPVPGTVAVRRNDAPVGVGSAAGQIAVDASVGVVQFVPDESRAIVAVAAGATTSIGLATAFSIAPARVAVDGFTGSAAAALNGQTFAVTSGSGTNLTLAVDTTGLAISTAALTVAKTFPGPSDVLTVAAEFDVPMKFDTDAMESSIDKKAANGSNLHTWSRIVLKEWPNPT